jgi:DNA polymerase III alpha subunit (gram-positive type)
MPNYIIYVQDTETTGLIPKVNEIIELSFIRLTKTESGFESDQKTWLFKAYDPSNIQDDALAINGHKKEDILWQTPYGRENYKKREDAIIEIEDWIAEDKMSAHDRVFAGQNPMFDFEHMMALWGNCNSIDTFPFLTGHNKLIVDTKHLALFFDICAGRKREKYSLGNLIKAFGVKKEKTHRADADTRMTSELLIKFIDACSSIAIEKLSTCE